MTVTVGGAPSEDPKELRRSPTLEKENAKREQLIHTDNDEKNKNNGATIATSSMNP